jgi:ATP-dependent DNA ligase
MLAKLADEVPAGDYLYEPKWDGFRAIVFRGADELYIQSRDLRPLDRYFPELHEMLLERLPQGAVVDGEIVIATDRGLDFDALQLRLHPAASRVAKLAKETPSSFIAFDVLAIAERNLMNEPQAARRAALDELLSNVKRPVHLTPVTRDRATALDWLTRFEGAGLDGVIAKPQSQTYEPGKRAMIKVKHARTAECVVAGFRWHKSGKDAVGSLLLGLYDDDGRLPGCDARASLARVGERRRRIEPHAWRAEPLERRQGPLVGTAEDRARLRSEVRPHAGRSLPARRAVPALASRQAPAGLPLRSARGHEALRARAHLLIRIERLLSRAQLRRHVLQIDANPRPRAIAPAH